MIVCIKLTEDWVKKAANWKHLFGGKYLNRLPNNVTVFNLRAPVIENLEVIEHPRTPSFSRPEPTWTQPLCEGLESIRSCFGTLRKNDGRK